MKEVTLIYDVKSLPDQIEMAASDILKIYREEGIVFYDSANGGDKPFVVGLEEDIKNIQIKDLNK